MTNGETTGASTPGQATSPESKPKFRSVEEAISECERELQVRTRCYAGWVDSGRLSGVDARDRFDRLSAAIHYLKQFDKLSEKVLDEVPF